MVEYLLLVVWAFVSFVGAVIAEYGLIVLLLGAILALFLPRSITLGTIAGTMLGLLIVLLDVSAAPSLTILLTALVGAVIGVGVQR